MSYLKQKKDTNHREVMQHLSAQGVEVIEALLPLDLCVFYRGFAGWIEVKIPGSDAVYTRPQLKFISRTRFPVAIVKDGPQAMRFLKTGAGLSQRQKDALAGYLLRSAKDRFTPKEIETVLACDEAAGV